MLLKSLWIAVISGLVMGILNNVVSTLLFYGSLGIGINSTRGICDADSSFIGTLFPGGTKGICAADSSFIGGSVDAAKYLFYVISTGRNHLVL